MISGIATPGKWALFNRDPLKQWSVGRVSLIGDAAHSTNACTAPTGYVADATDCDDTCRACNPHGTEVCDGHDNDRNGMTDGAHIRLMITRGVKSTPNQDPRFIVSGPTVVIVAEYKSPLPEAKARGYTLFTSTFRTTGSDQFDLRLNSHSRLNLIQALIQAIKAGADEALMLDPRGFVASCNSTNFFIVRGGEIWTSTSLYSFSANFVQLSVLLGFLNFRMCKLISEYNPV